MPQINLQRTVGCDADVFFASLVAIATYTDKISDVELIRPMGALPDGRQITEWTVNFEGAMLCWREAEVFDVKSRTFEFELIDGDLTGLQGKWSVLPKGPGVSSVEYFAEFDLGLPLLAEMLDPIASAAIESNIDQVIEHISAIAPHAIAV